jgi:hypothetical protein
MLHSILAALIHVNNAVPCSDSNSGTVAAPLCTIQAGVSKAASTGDTVSVHTGTYSEAVTVPAKSTAISGDSLAWPVLNGGIILGSSGSSGFKLEYFIIRPTNTQAFEIKPKAPGDSYWSQVTVRHITVDRFPSGPTLIFGTSAGNYPDGVAYDHIRISNGGSRRPITAFGMFGKNHTLTNFDIADVGGHVVLSSSVTSTLPGVEAITVRKGILRFLRCGFLTDGDGCFQGYNSRYEISYVVFDHVASDSSSVYGVANARRTTSASKPSGLHFHHNTVVGACGSEDTVGDTLNRGVELTNADVDYWWIHDNIFECYGTNRDSRGAAIRYRSCGGAGSRPGDDYNLFWKNIRDYSFDGCAAAVQGLHDLHVNPLLDFVSLAPLAGSPVCGAGSGGSDIGAIPCGTSVPPASPSPSPAPSPSPPLLPSPSP